MISGIFEAIERLIEYIPIDTDSPTNGHFGTGTTIDSRYYFEDIDGIAIRLGVLEVGNNTVSFRDIIKLFNKFLTDATIDEIVATKRYRQIQKISCWDYLYPNYCLIFVFTSIGWRYSECQALSSTFLLYIGST